jgi:Ribonuclease G/E
VAPVNATLLIESGQDEARAALLRDGRIEAYMAETAAAASWAGAVWLGRVRTVNEAAQAAFVDIGLDRDGFLNANDLPAARDAPLSRAVQEGQALLVQALRDAGGGKGIKLSARFAPAERSRLEAQLRGAAAPALLRPPRSLAERALRAHGAEAGRIAVWPPAALAEALRWAERQAPDLVPRFERPRADRPPFAAEGIEDAVAALYAPSLLLPCGAALRFGATAALTAIDVDRAGAIAPPAVINAEAAAEIGRQLRLRNIGGLVVVDFLRLPALDRAAAPALRAACAGDRVTVLDMSSLGLVELARQTTGRGLPIRA